MTAAVTNGLLAHAGAGESTFEELIPLVQWTAPAVVLLAMWVAVRVARRAERAERAEDGGLSLRERWERRSARRDAADADPSPPKRFVMIRYDDGQTLEDLTAAAARATSGGFHLTS